MDQEELIVELKTNFKFILSDDRISGLFLFGSWAEGSQYQKSDIDLCFVVVNRKEILEIYHTIMEHAENYRNQYDIRFFEELPFLIKIEIINKGIPILANDVNAVYEYFFRYRKLWEDQQFRIKYLI